MFNLTTRRITRAAAISAVYATVSLLLGELGYGVVQCRVSEALTILPLFMPEAIIGLTIGCLISNIVAYGAIDIIFGTLTTMVAAILTYIIGLIFKKSHLKLLGAIPPIILNAIFVPFIIMATVEGVTYYALFVSVLIGQSVAIVLLGIPLYFFVHRNKELKVFN